MTRTNLFTCRAGWNDVSNFNLTVIMIRSILEKGGRRVPEKLARKAASVYGLSAAMLPLETALGNVRPVDEGELALDFAALGYPGFAYLRSRRRKKNPAEVLFTALAASNLDMRLIEALP
jgi:hypothetical protein